LMSRQGIIRFVSINNFA